MVDVSRIHGCAMVVEIVQMVSMNQLIVGQPIEHVLLDYGNVIMVGASVSINDVMELMIAGMR